MSGVQKSNGMLGKPNACGPALIVQPPEFCLSSSISVSAPIMINRIILLGILAYVTVV